jgi:hypothetical protein
MAIPGFTADASCYRSSRSYRPGRTAGAGSALILPAEFICDDQGGTTVCTCEGLDNCIHMFGGATCTQQAQCDSTSGLVCGCIAA